MIRAFLLFFLFFYVVGLSQTRPHIGVECNYQYGKTVKHNNRFTVPVYSESNGLDINMFFKTIGSKNWHSHFSYPRFGLGLAHYSLGNRTNLGSLTSLYYHFNFTLLETKKWFVYTRVGAGPCLISKHYSIFNNKENTAIGSGYNNFFLLKFGTQYQVHSHLAINLSAGATHASNSRIKIPNLGVNTLVANIGLVYFFYNKDSLRFALRNDSVTYSKRLHYVLRTDLVSNQRGAPNGPNYFSNIVYTGINKQVSNKWKLGLGADFMFNQNSYYFYKEEFEDGVPFTKAVNIAPYVSGELMMGNFGLHLQMGTYVYNKQGGILPTKVGLNYYWLNFGKHKQSKAFASIFMRSHFAIADFISLGVGVEL